MGPRVLSVLLVSALMTCAACSDGGSEQARAPDGGGATEALAQLDIISTDVTVASGGDGEFEAGESGQDLFQGDRVRTDPTGFAEVVYFEGSWQRVENSATLTLLRLVATEVGQAVRTGIDQGRAWQRVQQLTQEADSFEVETPVATASVRGTAFAIDCTEAPASCTFAVTEGLVEIILPDGTRIRLTPGQVLTVGRDADPDQLVPEDVGLAALEQDDWISRNLVRDAENPPTFGGDAGAGAGDDDETGGDDGGTGAADDEDAEPVTATGGFFDEANAICVESGAENRIAAEAGGDTDTIALRQADVLDRSLDRLEGLTAPAATQDSYAAMIANYRERTALVRQAVDTEGATRDALVSGIMRATAAGSDAAARIGLASCVITDA
jgi:hypothetical protein